MPIAYVIDRESGLIRTSISGVLTDADLLAYKRDVIAELRRSPGLCELVDARGIDQVRATSAGIRAMADLDLQAADAYREGFRLAIVVKDDVSFGLARMYEMQTESVVPQVSVFREMTEATAWLGRTPPALPQPPRRAARPSAEGARSPDPD